MQNPYAALIKGLFFMSFLQKSLLLFHDGLISHTRTHPPGGELYDTTWKDDLWQQQCEKGLTKKCIHDIHANMEKQLQENHLSFKSQTQGI